MISHLELSIMTGTRAISGSAAMRLRNSTMAFLAVDQALIHVDVDDLRAVFHLITGNGQSCRVIASR